MIGVTRSAYFKAAKRQKLNDSRDKCILEEVRRIRKNMPKLGTRKVYYLLKPFLKEHNIKVGRDKLILRANGMLAERRKRIAFTTESRHYLFKSDADPYQWNNLASMQTYKPIMDSLSNFLPKENAEDIVYANGAKEGSHSWGKEVFQ
jgi:hypothetical protein